MLLSSGGRNREIDDIEITINARQGEQKPKPITKSLFFLNKGYKRQYHANIIVMNMAIDQYHSKKVLIHKVCKGCNGLQTELDNTCNALQ